MRAVEPALTEVELFENLRSPLSETGWAFLLMDGVAEEDEDELPALVVVRLPID